MLTDPNPYGTTGRHHRLNHQHTAARYHLKQGIAKCALKVKVEGKPMEDSAGRPMRYCNEMAERHSVKTLQKWADGYRTVALIPGAEICHQCKRLGRWCRCA